MKKIMAFILAVTVMAAAAAFAGAEGAGLFEQIQGRIFTFSSGAGAWSTELSMGENGEFTGNYHDSEMGETGKAFPEGTLYGCTFHGRFSDPQAVDEYTVTVSVETEMDEGQVPETIEDGVRYVTAVPYGLYTAKKVSMFLPGKPVNSLPEEFMFWSHLEESDPNAAVLPFYAIWNEEEGSGFIAEPDTEDATAEPAAEPAAETVAEPAAPLSAAPEAEPAAAPAMGGWTPAADPTVTDAVKALVTKGLNGMVGVNYKPVAYLGSQVVAGTNHAVLCQATVVYPGAEPKYVIMYLYEDLSGNVTILNIADFEVGSLCTYGTGAENGGEEAGELPAYAYTGDDPIEEAVANALAADPRAKDFLTEPGYVTIPCPIIHKTEMTDDTHAKVYGTFWILNYVRKGNALFNISGGEFPTVAALEKKDGRWTVTGMEEAGDGEDYAEDIRRFANGDSALEDQYFAAADLEEEANKAIRTRYIKNYVEANGLDITEYQDYGWDPVPLN